MSVNKYNKHILVLPEDDANRQIANGFINHVSGMYKYKDRMMLLLVDFDQDEKRLDYIKNL